MDVIIGSDLSGQCLPLELVEDPLLVARLGSLKTSPCDGDVGDRLALGWDVRRSAAQAQLGLKGAGKHS